MSTDVNAPDQVFFGIKIEGTIGFNSYDVVDDTTYWVVVDVGSGSGQVSLSTTKSNGYDPVPEPDWGMGNAMKVYNGTTWSDDSDGRSFRMSVNVTNSTFRGEVYIGLPQVGTATVARVFDDSGRIENVSWQWSRSTSSTGTFVDIPAAEGGTSNPYVPAASDLGMWLKATWNTKTGVPGIRPSEGGQLEPGAVAAGSFQCGPAWPVQPTPLVLGSANPTPTSWHRRSLRERTPMDIC